MSIAPTIAAPVLPAPARPTPRPTVAPVVSVVATGAARGQTLGAGRPETLRVGPVATVTGTTVDGPGVQWPAIEVLLTGVPSDLEPFGGFPSGPVDGYPRPTTYRLVPDSPEGPVLILPIGLWGDQPAAIFADVADRGFDVLVKSGSRRVGDHQHVPLRRYGSAAL